VDSSLKPRNPAAGGALAEVTAKLGPLAMEAKAGVRTKGSEQQTTQTIAQAKIIMGEMYLIWNFLFFSFYIMQ
jgi:hypothetical protein